MKSRTLDELRQMLVLAECRAYDSNWMVRMEGRKEVEDLKKRIAAKEKREARKNRANS